jgi:SAM-dependent methyltransferase
MSLVSRHAAPAADTTAADPGVCPISLDGERLREQVLALYDRVARSPRQGDFHFPVGAEHAVQRLGYDAAALARVPAASRDRFAGVGHPFAAGRVPLGGTVLDHACGAGTDLLLAALQAGRGGRAIGVDITPAMREVAAASAAELSAAGLAAPVRVLAGSFDALPLADASVDVVVSNGVLNLATDKLRVLQEARRVLRPGAQLLLADVVLARPLSPLARSNPALWAACVGGALTRTELLAALHAAGFEAVQVAAEHDCFAESALTLKLGGEAVVSSLSLSARTPA